MVNVNSDRTITRVSHICGDVEEAETCHWVREIEVFDVDGPYFCDDDELFTLLPDWAGHIWFTSSVGLVGVLDTEANNGEGKVLGTMRLPEGEEIENGFAADETGGMFLVSSQAMYRFDLDADADADGEPTITWREPYETSHRVKVTDTGSGTTPTLMGADFVAIADNADPQSHVLIYRRAKDVQSGRLICEEPLFKPGNSGLADSFMATDRSLVAVNNFGYKDLSLKRTENGRTTKPGITRVDIDADGNGCHTVWTNEEVIIPIITPTLSLATGLIYTGTKPKGPDNADAWYFTAIDFWTGEVVYSVLTGTGILYNPHAGLNYLGPDGRAWMGVIGGLIAIRDWQ